MDGREGSSPAGAGDAAAPGERAGIYTGASAPRFTGTGRICRTMKFLSRRECKGASPSARSPFHRLQEFPDSSCLRCTLYRIPLDKFPRLLCAALQLLAAATAVPPTPLLPRRVEPSKSPSSSSGPPRTQGSAGEFNLKARWCFAELAEFPLLQHKRERRLLRARILDKICVAIEGGAPNPAAGEFDLICSRCAG